MDKKKNLNLEVETVRELSIEQLDQVVGGSVGGMTTETLSILSLSNITHPTTIETTGASVSTESLTK